jgi:putrescine transport system permease protein
MEVFSAVRLGVKPEINAVASLILMAVSLMTFMVWYFSRKAEANRKRAIQEAMDQTASETWQPQRTPATA